MSSLKYAVLLTMSVVAAYLCLQIPLVRQYSLQLFALATIVYILLQRRWRGRFSLILPEHNAAHFALLNFACLLLVGSSGALSSPFFALSFIHLFFLALATPTWVALLIALEIMVFDVSVTIAWLSSLELSVGAWSNLSSIPVVMLFYVFAKMQYEKAYQNSLLMRAETRALLKAQQDDQAVAAFVASLLNKRLPMLEFLLSFPKENQIAIASEIVILKRDLNLLLRQIGEEDEGTEDDRQTADHLLSQIETELDAHAQS